MILNKKIIVIYGSPKTGTSHLFRTLIRHDECFGIDSVLVGDGKGEGNNKEYSTNEPYDLPLHSSPPDGWPLDKRWWKGYGEGKKYMVVKAPGFCMAWNYFNNLRDYECKYIFTDREMMEVVESMGRQQVMINMADADNAKSGGCPEPLLSIYGPLWKKAAEKSDLIRRTSRFYYMYNWHIESIPDVMKEVSLDLGNYKGRLDTNKTAIDLLYYLELGFGSRDWYDHLKTFYYRPIDLMYMSYLEELVVK
jgi:hypothetical protein